MEHQETIHFMYGNANIPILFNYITDTPDGSLHVMLGRYRPVHLKPAMVSEFENFISLNYGEFISDIKDYISMWDAIELNIGITIKRNIHNEVQPLLQKVRNHIEKYGRIKDNDLYYLLDTYVLLNASIEEEYEHRTRHDLNYYQSLYLTFLEQASSVFFDYLWVIDPNTQQPMKLSSLIRR